MNDPRVVILRSILACLLSVVLWNFDACAWWCWVPLALMFCPELLDTCTIFTDDYATDRTGTDYTTVSGTFTVGSGVITTGSAGALIVENTAGTTGHGRATITGKVDTSGGSFGIVGSYVDSNNYLFGELTVNGASSTWKLWKRVAGANTQLGTTSTFTASTGTNYTICVSWDGAYASGIATIASAVQAAHDAYTGTGNKAGFMASPNGGTATFDNFTFAKHYDDDHTCSTCGGVACTVCSTAYDGGFEFNVSGVANSICASCTTYNGLWILPGPPSSDGSGGCLYNTTYTSPCSIFNNKGWYLKTSLPCTPGNAGLQFYIDHATSGESWYLVFNPRECRGLSGDAMTVCYGTSCDLSASSVTVTSI